MKRLVTSIILCLLVYCASAQQHMKFMGIPIDGNINNFTTKLKAKGATISPNNKYAGKGLRIFDGEFYDRPCEFAVRYNKKTGTVYEVLTIIKSDTRHYLENLMEEIKNVIEDKYVVYMEEGKTNGGDDIDIYRIYPTDDEPSYSYGLIYLGISQEDDYPNDYALNITYSDIANSTENYESMSNDI